VSAESLSILFQELFDQLPVNPAETFTADLPGIIEVAAPDLPYPTDDGKG
jgi:hypothetical protein